MHFLCDFRMTHHSNGRSICVILFGPAFFFKCMYFKMACVILFGPNFFFLNVDTLKWYANFSLSLYFFFKSLPSNLRTRSYKNYLIPVPQDPKPVIKTISERKRIKITCSTVLRETTACPFRHHRSWFQCFFCTQAFMEMTALRLHTAQIHTDLEGLMNQLKRYPRSLQIDISELQCRRCELNLYDVESMRVHLLSTHSLVIYKECIADYKVNGSPYTCHLCSKQFHVFRTLTTHLNEHYANYICDICGKSYLNSKRLKVHNRTHESGCFPCTKCGKVLKTKTSQVNHLESHSKRIIKCQICSKPMKHYNDRIKHMSEEHNITHKFKCPICSREYNIKHYLATHIRQTHGHKNKKCSECGMAFVTNHGLKKHMQKHIGLKAFPCQVCSKTYARSYSLREHMRQHDT